MVQFHRLVTLSQNLAVSIFENIIPELASPAALVSSKAIDVYLLWYSDWVSTSRTRASRPNCLVFCFLSCHHGCDVLPRWRSTYSVRYSIWWSESTNHNSSLGMQLECVKMVLTTIYPKIEIGPLVTYIQSNLHRGCHAHLKSVWLHVKKCQKLSKLQYRKPFKSTYFQLLISKLEEFYKVTGLFSRHLNDYGWLRYIVHINVLM